MKTLEMENEELTQRVEELEDEVIELNKTITLMKKPIVKFSRSDMNACFEETYVETLRNLSKK